MFTRTTTAIFCLLGGTSLTQAAGQANRPQTRCIAYTAGTIDIEAAKLRIENLKTRDVGGFRQ